jgi:ABC-type lipoprotein export system ATPase subunit
MQAKEKSSNSSGFKPKKVSDLTTLKNMSLQIKKGEFVCIIGDVGSGKSSVLNSMIGDLLYLEKDFYQVFKGMEVNDYLSSRIRQLS